jgi:cell division protein FtsW
MLVVKKGDHLRKFSRGLLPFLVVLGGLCLLVAAEPDLSVAMLYTLLMAIVLFAGGVRVGHFVLIAALGVPFLWREIERVQYAVLRLTSFLDPGSATSAASYQLHQSLVAVGSGGAFGSGFGRIPSATSSPATSARNGAFSDSPVSRSPSRRTRCLGSVSRARPGLPSCSSSRSG